VRPNWWFVALRYLEASGSISFAYINDNTLLSTVWRMLCANPIATQKLARSPLAAQVQGMMAERLNPIFYAF
jgi:hypothetical protein